MIEEELDAFTERFAEEFGFQIWTSISPFARWADGHIGWRMLSTHHLLEAENNINHLRRCYFKQVNAIIEQADLAECLTSPHQYIREYRKYYENSLRRKI